MKGKVISAARVPKKVTHSVQLIDDHEEQENNESVHRHVIIGARASTNYYSFLKPLEPLSPLPEISIEKENLDTITCCSI